MMKVPNGTGKVKNRNMKRTEINIRDPFMLVWEGTYYLYGTRGPTCWGKADGFDVYVGKDLENWDGPFEIFHNDGSFWADRNYWAPEVFRYREQFFLMASFKAEGRRRGTQILVSDSPAGPFIPVSDDPVTPGNWECLDGTFYVEDDQPYMVFCHEHRQVVDGEICMIPLTADLKSAAGKPELLFRASQCPYVESIEQGHLVTDGPFLYRCAQGELLMLWSTFGTEGYLLAVARSESGRIKGPWIQDEKPLFEKDGGHGMIFNGLDGKIYLTLHAPNETQKERPVFLPLREENGRLWKEK